ncbi:MAG: ATP-binding protein [bacterium]|nr:ATP-binding protein [bacterium]
MSSIAPAQVDATPGLSPTDLAELVGAFNEVTARLQSTHEQLRGEVARLQQELTDTRGQLRRAKELAALGEMAAGIAHEVRNPLVSIRLFGEALVSDLSDRPEEQGLAGKIVRSVDRLNAVVGDVLNFARDLRVQSDVIEVDALLRDVAEVASGYARSVGVDLTVVASPGTQVSCDRGLLQQAILNVVRNGCEASADVPDGARRVEVSVQERRGRTPDGASRPELAFCVADSGPGFPTEVRDRVFNPFFTTRETGTGLGLAIVHRILDAHDGSVVIASNENAGALVELRVPLCVSVEHAGDESPQQTVRSLVMTSEA